MSCVGHVSEDDRKKPIGFFDSGVGGITVLKDAIRLLPGEDYLYYADSGNVPYGEKKSEEVGQCVLEAASFLIRKGIKALVIACNTATSVAASQLRSLYNIPIIGMEPAVKPAVKKNGEGQRVLVIATPLTLSENKFKNLVETLDGNKVVDFIPAPELVEYAECGMFSSPALLGYIEKLFSHMDLSKYGALVLGCTHYIYFRDVFRKILPRSVDIIDGNEGTVRNLRNKLENCYMLNPGCKGSVSYFVTSNRAANPDEEERFRFFFLSAP
jgi:glutamate racemase